MEFLERMRKLKSKCHGRSSGKDAFGCSAFVSATASVLLVCRRLAACITLACIVSISILLWRQFLEDVTTVSSGTSVKLHISLQQQNGLELLQIGLPALSTDKAHLKSYVTDRSVCVKDAVIFPNNVLLLVKAPRAVDLVRNVENLECKFSGLKNKSNVTSIKLRSRDLYMVRCDHPVGMAMTAASRKVNLAIRGSDVNIKSKANYSPNSIPTWEDLVYDIVVHADEVILLVKGLITQSQKRLDASRLVCVFGTEQTGVISAAQEIVRCVRPASHLEKKLKGQRVTVSASWRGLLPSVAYYDPTGGSFDFVSAASMHSYDRERVDDSIVSEIAISQSNAVDVLGLRSSETEDSLEKIQASVRNSNSRSASKGMVNRKKQPKYKLCACTMVWNKAKFLKEWVIYHSFLGVQKYFVYDNDSNDGTLDVLESLLVYNVSIVIWPWVKTQQAAFSLCSIFAKSECVWMMFSDVDEYMYPVAYLQQVHVTNASSAEGPALSSKIQAVEADSMVLHRLIDEETTAFESRSQLALGQIQFDCNNFGPSGLEHHPAKGVTVGYSCRLAAPERHKSIVMLQAINSTLLNVLHHFELSSGFDSVRLSRGVAVVNHYKFQCWDVFKSKFVRRAGTYTTDWKKAENRTSRDRTPGLGTKAVKPNDWASRFCEVNDTRLRQFVTRTFTTPSNTGSNTGKLLWE